jgi:hypothetical protein
MLLMHREDSRSRGNDQGYAHRPNASKETGEVLRRDEQGRPPSDILRQIAGGTMALPFL